MIMLSSWSQSGAAVPSHESHCVFHQHIIAKIVSKYQQLI